ncbi:hypothetical protein GCM10009609_14100 [Pseudonocardia aurantiaca]
MATTDVDLKPCHAETWFIGMSPEPSPTCAPHLVAWIPPGQLARTSSACFALAHLQLTMAARSYEFAAFRAAIEVMVIDLPQQGLITSDVDEPGLPRIRARS